MKTLISEIETLFGKKIMVYKDIVDTLDKEKEILKKSDMVALWETSERKKKLADEIESIRLQILDHLTSHGIDHQMDKMSFNTGKILDLLKTNHNSPLKKVNLHLMMVKKEIQARATQNKRFVQDYLSFVEDLFYTIADLKKDDPTYDNKVYPNQTGKKNVFLHKEV